mmetsp:Transcript_37513/g.90487  ORF Transcript_37513/g.90487 Transcript_37513/m.90487 type:complete len:217 (+) Transcript_37513:2096-2746(+)
MCPMAEGLDGGRRVVVRGDVGVQEFLLEFDQLPQLAIPTLVPREHGTIRSGGCSGGGRHDAVIIEVESHPRELLRPFPIQLALAAQLPLPPGPLPQREIVRIPIVERRRRRNLSGLVHRGISVPVVLAIRIGDDATMIIVVSTQLLETTLPAVGVPLRIVLRQRRAGIRFPVGLPRFEFRLFADILRPSFRGLRLDVRLYVIVVINAIFLTSLFWR